MIFLEGKRYIATSCAKMKLEKIIGILLIAITVGIFIPYAFLTLLFEYPNVQTHTNVGYKSAIAWFAIVMLGLPLLAAYILLEKKETEERKKKKMF